MEKDEKTIEEEEAEVGRQLAEAKKATEKLGDRKKRYRSVPTHLGKLFMGSTSQEAPIVLEDEEENQPQGRKAKARDAFQSPAPQKLQKFIEESATVQNQLAARPGYQRQKQEEELNRRNRSLIEENKSLNDQIEKSRNEFSEKVKQKDLEIEQLREQRTELEKQLSEQQPAASAPPKKKKKPKKKKTQEDEEEEKDDGDPLLEASERYHDALGTYLFENARQEALPRVRKIGRDLRFRPNHQNSYEDAVSFYDTHAKDLVAFNKSRAERSEEEEEITTKKAGGSKKEKSSSRSQSTTEVMNNSGIQSPVHVSGRPYYSIKEPRSRIISPIPPAQRFDVFGMQSKTAPGKGSTAASKRKQEVTGKITEQKGSAGSRNKKKNNKK